MRKLFLIVLMAVIMVSALQILPVFAETTSSDVAKKVEEALQAIKAYLVDKKGEAVAHGKMLIESMDEKIEALETKAAESSDKTKAEYDEAIEDLKQKRDIAEKKLDELGQASAASWESAKKDFSEASDALNDAYEDALEKIK